MYKYLDKTVLTTWCIFLAIFLLVAGAPQPGYAQTPEVTPAPATSPTDTGDDEAPVTDSSLTQVLLSTAEVTFAQLNQPILELQPPLTQYQFSFERPYRWDITSGDNYLELYYDNLQPEEANLSSQDGKEVNNRAIVSIYFNDILLTTFSPVDGRNQVVRLSIPPEAVSNPQKSNHQVRFVYLSQDCTNLQNRSLFVIHRHSLLHFSYNLLPLQINLADFPRPLVQNPYALETVLIIIPNEYSTSDLAAAASVAATMGQRTYGGVNLDLITASEATPERLANTSVIIIGQPRKHPFLLDLYARNRLPTTLNGPDSPLIIGPSRHPVRPGDGVLQEIPSDFGDNAVYLIVTGATDLAVIRAAQALSVPAPRYGFEGNLVIISDFQGTVAKEVRLTDTFTLAELGFSNETFYGIGSHKVSIPFFIPANWRVRGSPALTISYLHSLNLQPSGSSLTVNLNERPVSNLPIDQMVLGERQVVFKLPINEFKIGRQNRLSFEAEISVDLAECIMPDLSSNWIRISGDSQLQLPHVEVEEEDIVLSLKEPLIPFVSRQDLGDVWFSLPDNPSHTELSGMITVAAWLGNLSRGSSFAPRVSLGAISEIAQLEPYHMIAFGLPTKNRVIAMINEPLPQPFVPGSNNLRQQIGSVDYRLPGRFSLGLLQVLRAPWNSRRAVLVVTGTTVEGVERSINALTHDETYYSFEGNVAFLSKNRIESLDSTQFIRGSLLTAVTVLAEEGEELELEAVTPAVPVSTLAISNSLSASGPTSDADVAVSDRFLPPDSSPPPIITQLIYGLIGAGVLIGIVGGVLSWHRARKR